jgi:hypothetical protein
LIFVAPLENTVAFNSSIGHLFFGCTTKNPQADSDAIRTDSAEVSKNGFVMSTGTLTIKSKEAWMRDAPNMGRPFLKLKADDTCKIISAGRFDVIEGKANLWYQIESHGQVGWIFGSQTDRPGFDFRCENPFHVLDSLQSKQVKIRRLGNSSFDQLWIDLGLALKKLEVTIEDAEGGGVGVQVFTSPNEIRVEHFESCGLYVSEIFTVAHRTNRIALINYRNKTGCTSWYQFGATWVATKENSLWRITAEMPGTIELDPVDMGSEVLLVADKSLKSFAWLTPCTEHAIFLLDAAVNSISYRQSVGHDFDRDPRNQAHGIWGAPPDWFDLNGSVLSTNADRIDTKLSMTNRAGNIILTVTESDRNVERPARNRNFQWNRKKDLFEEID